ncbi:MAG: cysteine--tRNA ligase [Candidatus Nanohaloarchaeota archaeon QJJ-5]|nr:cysteine--tRNA ligase [Candidatus Nanohaloarchaeota archaeon QJJ-5]
MTLRVYDSNDGEKQRFEPIDDDRVRMYVCGQTVYDYMHIGHGRTYIAFDIIRRWLEFKGYAVQTVINITDVNDKINNRAEEEDREPHEVAEEYAQINLEDFESLGVTADAYPKASEYVDEMIEMVQELIDNGLAYESEGNVFFDVHAFEDYGKLSNQDLEHISPERDDILGMDAKEHPEDFVLWRARTHGPTWDSPWGEGIPGWHIECSAMSSALLGEQFDIHGGGSDLVFPHHEDEIAQAEGATGEKPWVNYWMHSGLVRMKDEKMSKSLGNFVPTRELLEEYDPAVLRLMIASTHYRKPFEYSEEALQEAKNNVAKLRNAVENVKAELRAVDTVPAKYDAADHAALNALYEHREQFIDAMDDDFNTPKALSHLYAIAEQANKYVGSADPKRPVLEKAAQFLQELGQVIGVLEDVEVSSDAGPFIDLLVDVREQLRENEQYEPADMIRDRLQDHGVVLEDTDDGGRWAWDQS